MRALSSPSPNASTARACVILHEHHVVAGVPVRSAFIATGTTGMPCVHAIHSALLYKVRPTAAPRGKAVGTRHMQHATHTAASMHAIAIALPLPRPPSLPCDCYCPHTHATISCGAMLLATAAPADTAAVGERVREVAP